MHSEIHRHEAAWLDITPSGSCGRKLLYKYILYITACFSTVPDLITPYTVDEKVDFAFPPFSNDISVFVHHPNAAQLLVNETAPIIKSFSGGIMVSISNVLVTCIHIVDIHQFVIFVGH